MKPLTPWVDHTLRAQSTMEVYLRVAELSESVWILDLITERAARAGGSVTGRRGMAVETERRLTVYWVDTAR